MLNSFRIKNYKCFDDFEITNLGRINIFLGENNVGKSSILEAIFGYACGKQLSPFIERTLFRLSRDGELNLYPLIEKVLNTFNNRKKLEFSFEGKIDNKVKKYIYKIEPSSLFREIDVNLNNNTSFVEERKINFASETEKRNNRILFNFKLKADRKIISERPIFFPFFSNNFVQEDPFLMAAIITSENFRNSNLENMIYSYLKRDMKKFEKFLEYLNKSFKNSIEKIDMFPYPDGTPAPISVKAFNGNFIPLYEFGEGMQKWFSVLGNQMIYKDSIQCIDEIGDMLHPKAQGSLGLNLSEISRENNNQIFATTQSLEFVSNYLSKVKEENEELLDDIKIITLRNVGNKIKSRVLSGEEALELLRDNEMELR